MRYAAGKVYQGKRWKHLLSGLADRWVEPFCGGLGVYPEIHTTYTSALLSDLSPVTDMWNAAKLGWEPDLTPIDKDQWLRHRASAFGSDPCPQDVYAVHCRSFGGKAKGGWAKEDHMPSGLRRFRAVVKALRASECAIHRCDYRKTLRECGNGDAAYLDPPYGNNDGFWIIPNAAFDLAEMVAHAEAAAARGAVVLISCYTELDPDKWDKIMVNRDSAISHNRKTVVTKYNDEFLWRARTCP